MPDLFRAARLRALLMLIAAASAAPAAAQNVSFAPGTQYASGSDTPSVAFADLNHDGKPDLIVATCENGTVRVRLGDGAGNFGAPTDFPLLPGGAAFGLAIGDFNEDGHLDIATADSNLSGYVAVFLGHGDGTFDPVTEFPVGSFPNMVIAADLNGDGHLDLVTPDTASDTITVLRGNGAGGFSAAPGSPFATGGHPTSVRAGDLNSDQVPDLVATNFNDSTVSVFLGTGSNFNALTPFVVDAPGAAGPMDVGILDVDGNGIPDLVVAAYAENLLYVFSGNDNGDGFGDGTFTAGTPLATGTFPTAIEVADANGDGIRDVLVANFGNDSVSIFQGTGSFSGLASAISLATAAGSGPEALATADINGDGKLDLVVGYGGIDDSEVFLNGTCCFVTVTMAGAGTGFVASSPARINCTPDCTRAFDSSFSVELDATPDVGSLFSGWSGACSGTGPCLLPAGSDALVTATFDHLDLTPPSVPAATVGVPFSATIAATNGTAPYVFTVASGSLPPGLSLDVDTGDLAGTPTQAGTFAFTVSGQDSFGVYGTRAYSITVAAGATLTFPAPAVLTYHDAAQVTTLSAAVSNVVGVDAGTVTFTVRDASNAIVGSPVTSGTVSGGSASASYTLPAGTSPQSLTITASYSGAANFLASSGAGALLLIAAPSTTGSSNVTASYSTATQPVLLAASVNSPNGMVNSGSVTFTVRDGANVVIGSPASGTVAVGLATASYILPAGTLPQTLTVTAAFSGSTNFTASADATHTLVVTPASTSTAPAPAAVAFSASAQSIPLSAAVSSAGGTVGSGTVTFTVRTAGLATIGSSVSGAVSNGVASANYMLPGGTPVQPLTITAAFGATSAFAASIGTSTLQVGCPSIVVAPTAPPVAWLGQPFSMPLSAAGFGDAVFGVTGTLPPGLSLNGSTVVGTPTALGRFDITATATSAAAGGCSGTQTYAFRVMRAPLFAAGSGGGATVNTFDRGGTLAHSILAEDAGFTGGIRVAMADFNGDGIDDVITAPGPGAAAPTVRIFDGASGTQLQAFDAYPAGTPGGVVVAVADVNGDGVLDTVTGRDGATPEVRVFDGRTGVLVGDFLAYNPAVIHGVSVAVGDLDGDGVAEIITGPGPGGPPEVRVFRADGTRLLAFNAYDPTFLGGVSVAAGDVDGDGRADIITGAGPGGGPHVRVFSGLDLHEIDGFMAYPAAFTGGVRVAAGDLDLDGHAEIITGAGPGGSPHVKVWDGATGAPIASLLAFNASLADGVFVAAPPPLARTVIDTPVVDSTVGPMFLVGGWAAAPGVTTGSGIDAVHVWALPVAGGAPTFLGTATTGISRPDVAAKFGGSYAESGFSLIAGPLPPGAYLLVAFAHNARSGTFTSAAIVRIVVP